MSHSTTTDTGLPPHDPDRTETQDGLGDPGMSNGQRAGSAAAALADPASLEHDYEYSDLICGLLHLGHSNGLDPEAILRSAEMHFEAEAGALT